MAGLDGKYDAFAEKNLLCTAAIPHLKENAVVDVKEGTFTGIVPG
jgi:hypothetical protein